MEEDDVGLDQAVAFLAVGNLGAADVLAHLVIWVGRLAVDAALGSEAAVSFDDQVGRNTGGALQAVNVLGEELVEEALAGQEADEDMGDGRVEFAWVEILGKHVEWLGVFLEERQAEDIFGLLEVQGGQVGIETSLGRAKVGDCKIGK